MKIAILDDYFDTLRTLRCFGKLDGDEVTIYTDHVQDEDELADRLRDIFDQIVAYADGAPTNVVNPDALEHARPRP